MKSTSSSLEIGFCKRSESHRNQPIQYICLDPQCELKRLLCRLCVNESHRKHNVGIIDKLIAPLNRLNMNSYYEKSADDYLFFKKRIQDIRAEWEEFNKIFEENMEQLQEGIIFQLAAVMETFTNTQIDSAYQVLTNGNSEISVVNQYVRMINFLDKDYLQDVDKLKKYTNSATDEVIKIINKTGKKMKALLGKMQKLIKQIDFDHFKDQEKNPKLKEENQDSDTEKPKSNFIQGQKLAEQQKRDNQDSMTSAKPLTSGGIQKEQANSEDTNKFPIRPILQRKSFVKHK